MDIDALKQAAIDAYMRSNGWSVDSSYTMIGVGYSARVEKDGTGQESDSNGWLTEIDLTDEFAQIRTRVDDALKPWQEDRMPDPAELNGGMVKAQEALTALNIGDGTSLAGALGGYFETVRNNAKDFHGAAMDAFNNSFVSQLPAVINNHGCLAAIVTEAWAAEKQIWTDARTDRDKVVEDSTTALHDYSRTSSSAGLDFVLALAGAAISGASAVASAGVTLPYSIASATITAISATTDLAEAFEVERQGDSYDKLMEAFEGGLDDIDAAITKQETLVMEALNTAWKVFEDNRPLFDLTPRVSDNGDGVFDDSDASLFDVADASGLEIVLPGQPVIDSLSSGLINLASGLDQADPKITAGADDGGLLSSSAREVGLRSGGVTTFMGILGYNNSISIRDLAWDVRQGNAMLLAVIQDFQNADADSQAALDQLRGALVGGSGEDAW
ncbi:hypothetical protein [Nocardioides sp. GXZ039]|uniref:hypothetical protein n=1 Tax=Nocardioides sp. GXZ039 TaxID=3136018 RepID=UPI0030F3EB71